MKPRDRAYKAFGGKATSMKLRTEWGGLWPSVYNRRGEQVILPAYC